MKRLAPMAAAFAIASLVAAACNRPSERSPAQTGTAGAAAAESTRQNLDITFKSEPDPPKMGENTFEVTVMSGHSQVTDAEVSVEFYMAGMPMMNMPEMRNSVPLKHEGSGRYRGVGNVATAGKWDATVKVMRSGQDLGTRKFSITAKQ